MAAYHVLTKPMGPACNLRCSYCFYLEKSQMFGAGRSLRMSDDMLETFVRDHIESQDAPEIEFAWQGGEPTLLGVDFFRRALALQRRHANGRRITNALQTNGTLIDDAWAGFFAENGFLVGISIDGPAELHDAYRVDAHGAPSFGRVLRGLRTLQAHGVEFNTLTVVNRLNAKHPLKVYRFLKEIGSRFLQFIPLVERKVRSADGATLAGPPPDAPGARAGPTSWSVTPVGYGDFLTKVFDEWVRRDVARVYVQMFDVALANWFGAPPGLCIHAKTCGAALALEHTGDLYACDHFVEPAYRLGNIREQHMIELIASEKQAQFGRDKFETLPAYCRDCDVRFACHGGCPKDRFICTPDGQPGLNYLCAGYKLFFHHIADAMEFMVDELKMQRPPANIMPFMAENDALARRVYPVAGRNEPCPCGSGRKYKQCHGAPGRA